MIRKLNKMCMRLFRIFRVLMIIMGMKLEKIILKISSIISLTSKQKCRYAQMKLTRKTYW